MKTAGTSMEVMLSPYTGPDDVVTRIGGQDDERRKAGFGPRNYKGGFNPFPMLWTGPTWRRFRTFRKFLNRRKFYQHMAGYEVKSRVPTEKWDGYFKFCIERNPWDKVVSAYYYHLKMKSIPRDMSFRDYVYNYKFRPDWFMYTINDEIIVDRVLKYENLAEELDQIKELIGLPAGVELPVRNAGARPDSATYRKHYDSELREVIARKYSREIEAFGYCF